MTNTYRVYDAETGRFIMTAPLDTLREAFGLHEAAVDRVRREAGVTRNCALHFNGRIHFGAKSVNVSIA